MLNICLFEPEIPQNTGNIARTCAATGTRLHLVRPLGFDISEKAVRHAGLDYWKDVEIIEYDNVDQFMEIHREDALYFFSTKAQKRYTEPDYTKDDEVYLIFGKESRGIDELILMAHKDRCVRIPMVGDTRSLNLSNSAAIAVYEALRQRDFAGMNDKGELHRHRWEDAR